MCMAAIILKKTDYEILYLVPVIEVIDTNLINH